MIQFLIDGDAWATDYVSFSTTVSATVFRMEIHSRSKIKIIFCGDGILWSQLEQALIRAEKAV